LLYLRFACCSAREGSGTGATGTTCDDSALGCVAAGALPSAFGRCCVITVRGGELAESKWDAGMTRAGASVAPKLLPGGDEICGVRSPASVVAGTPALPSEIASGAANATNVRVSLDREGCLSNGESVLITTITDTAAVSPTRAAASLGVIPTPTRHNCAKKAQCYHTDVPFIFVATVQVIEWSYHREW